MIKLAICDDQVLFLRGLKYIIADFDEIEIIIEVTRGEDLLEQVKFNRPDVVLLDMKMPGMDGIEVTRFLRTNFPEIKIILLSMYDEERLITHVLEIGANGYLLKNEEPEILKEAIESVMTKDYYFNDYVANALIKGLKRKERSAKAPISFKAPSHLTTRELEILKLISEELTTAEIAKKLFISVRTVEGHRKNLMEKTGVRNTAGLIIFAIKNKLIELS
ncbi:MAG: response regulator [Saprospiraceae bacterium]